MTSILWTSEPGVLGLLNRLAPRKSESEVRPAGVPAAASDPVFNTRALKKFLAPLKTRDQCVLLDLGPVVGGNVSFFGEQLACKIFVEDLFADLDRHVHQATLDAFPEFLQKRLPHAAGTVDGILCWDFIDYLNRPAAQALAAQLTRVLRPEGALLGFFGTAQPRGALYTKYLIANDVTLRHRTYPAARGRQTVLLNRDIIRLFPGLRVSDSFLLMNNLREILFRKPA